VGVGTGSVWVPPSSVGGGPETIGLAVLPPGLPLVAVGIGPAVVAGAVGPFDGGSSVQVEPPWLGGAALVCVADDLLTHGVEPHVWHGLGTQVDGGAVGGVVWQLFATLHPEGVVEQSVPFLQLGLFEGGGVPGGVVDGPHLVQLWVGVDGVLLGGAATAGGVEGRMR